MPAAKGSAHTPLGPILGGEILFDNIMVVSLMLIVVGKVAYNRGTTNENWCNNVFVMLVLC
jgi:hypothetical protein